MVDIRQVGVNWKNNNFQLICIAPDISGDFLCFFFKNKFLCSMVYFERNETLVFVFVMLLGWFFICVCR